MNQPDEKTHPLWQALLGGFPPHEAPLLTPEEAGARETRRLALVLAYDGARFAGWQVQAAARTVQGGGGGGAGPALRPSGAPGGQRPHRRRSARPGPGGRLRHHQPPGAGPHCGPA